MPVFFVQNSPTCKYRSHHTNYAMSPAFRVTLNIYSRSMFNKNVTQVKKLNLNKCDFDLISCDYLMLSSCKYIALRFSQQQIRTLNVCWNFIF